MDPQGDQPSSGVSSISTTSRSVSGKAGDSTTNKSVGVGHSASRLPGTEHETLLPELAEQRSAITDGDTHALQEWQDRANAALHRACISNQVDTVKNLLSLGASPSTVQWASTPLQQAAGNGLADVCKVLLDGGADVNLATDRGTTPLQQAARNGHADVCTVLLDRGADINLATNFGGTPLLQAADKGHADICKFLLDGGAVVNLATQRGTTPLLVAAGNGYADACKVLLDGGADVNLAAKFGNTPLLVAAGNGHADACKVLLDGGADVNLAAKDGHTPLEIATRYGHADVREVLVDGGADEDLASKNREGGGGPLQASIEARQLSTSRPRVNIARRHWQPTSTAAAAPDDDDHYSDDVDASFFSALAERESHRNPILATGKCDPVRAKSDSPTGNKRATVRSPSMMVIPSDESGYGSAKVQRASLPDPMSAAQPCRPASGDSDLPTDKKRATIRLPPAMLFSSGESGYDSAGRQLLKKEERALQRDPILAAGFPPVPEAVESDRVSTSAVGTESGDKLSSPESNPDAVKSMKMFIIPEKHRFFSGQEYLYTLEEKFKVKVETGCVRENTRIKAHYLESGDADAEDRYDREMATVKIVMGVNNRTTMEERQKLADNVAKVLQEECGVELTIVNINDG